MSDSDVSEFECETQLDDYKNRYNQNKRGHSNTNNNNNNNNNNINNNNDDNSTTASITINVQVGGQKESNNKNVISSSSPASSAYMNNNNNDNLNKVEAMLRSAFESAEATITDENDFENNMTVLNGDDMDHGPASVKESIRNEFNKYLEACDTGDVAIARPPPDILIESATSLNDDGEAKSEDENCKEKPDILKNVGRSSITVLDLDEGRCGDAAETMFDGDRVNVEKDDQIPWGMTPVDIVGNFEQEVEREFGLLVSGYKNNATFDSDEYQFVVAEKCMNLEEEEHFNGHFLKKVRRIRICFSINSLIHQ